MMSRVPPFLLLLSMAVWIPGCFKGAEPIPPHEALAQAAQRINAILEQERASNREPAALQPAETPKDATEVSFWYYSHPVASQMITQRGKMAAFASAHPEVKLEPQYIGDWTVAVQKLTVTLAAGDAPDVALVKRPWLARLIPSGQIVPLDALLPAPLLEDIRAPSRASFTVKGKLYALPADGFCSILYYNRDMVADPPPKTWDELRAAAQKACRPDDNPRAAVYGLGDLPFLETLWSCDGDVCDEVASGLDTVQAQEALDFVLSLRNGKLIHPRALGDPDGAFALFLGGRVAMTVASSEYLPRAEKSGLKFGVAPAPGKTGPVSMLSDNAVVVFAKYAEAKRAAIAEFLDFFTGLDVQGKDAAALGSVPARTTVSKDISVAPGLAEAYMHARNTPLVPAYGPIEFELYRYLSLAYQWRP
jgi:ABC-type glycerol-3-phosphate transport system substrate-binding protein